MSQQSSQQSSQRGNDRYLRRQSLRRAIPFVVWLLAVLFVLIPLLGHQPGLRLTGLAILAQHKVASQTHGGVPRAQITAKQEIMGYVPEQLMLKVKIGQRVTMRRRADRTQKLQGSIRALGTRVVQVPRNANPGSTSPTWGLPIHITLPQGLEVTPGESFDLILELP